MGNEFGRNIKDFRKIHGIKQEVLANEIGCSVGYISNVESGKRIPSLPMAAKIAKALGTSLDLLLREDYLEHADTYKELIQRLEHYPSKNQQEICTFFIHNLDFLESYNRW